MSAKQLPLIAMLCLTSGCLTAARKVEQSIRRGSDDSIKQQEPAPDARIAVRPGHPRLFVTDQWPAATDALSKDWQAQLIKRADDLSAKPPIEYSPHKLLTRSREALRRLSLFAGVYRFTGDKKYAEAGRKELLNVCGFPTWQPDDFLATGEMMMAVGTAYDWLYDALPPEDRRTVVDSIIRLGLRPAMQNYETAGGWTTAKHNWNLVCNGGTIVAALAIAEEQPSIARKVLNEAMRSIQYGLQAYDEHGGTPEGPMYHSYATRYLTFAAAALTTASERGAGTLTRIPTQHSLYPVNSEPEANWIAWTRAADFRVHMTGPSGKVANFGDGAEILGNTAWMLWLADQLHNGDYAHFETAVDHDDPSIFDLLWYQPAAYETVQSNAPGPQPATAAIFGTAITLRSTDNQSFLALRTGSTADHHSHLDLGNFVLDMLGERFASDFGADNYDLPGYLGPRRAEYLRSSTPGHNTLSIGEASQPLDAESKSSLTQDSAGHPVARIDMTAGYPGAAHVVRTAMLDGDAVTIDDDIRMIRAAKFTWNLHTAAKVTKERGGATLDLNGKRVQMRVLEPDDAFLVVEPDVTDPPEEKVEGITHVRILTPSSEKTRIRVEFRPLR